MIDARLAVRETKLALALLALLGTARVRGNGKPDLEFLPQDSRVGDGVMVGVAGAGGGRQTRRDGGRQIGSLKSGEENVEEEAEIDGAGEDEDEELGPGEGRSMVLRYGGRMRRGGVVNGFTKDL